MDRHKLLTRCYSIAVYRLRQKYDDEFQSILAQVYEENGVDVQKRPSRVSMQNKRKESP